MKLKKKRRELEDMRQIVVLKATAQDPARNRKKETKEKLQNFKYDLFAKFQNLQLELNGNMLHGVTENIHTFNSFITNGCSNYPT